ncbi:SpoIIE family protein phosphatase [Streptomyces sp. NPDC048751]|uniref:SpoIIE family protein phosphatase n=1 Tax=Streptomyces sp. NPDC048751 TaxID=3365591 RepID=UPI00371E05E3
MNAMSELPSAPASESRPRMGDMMTDDAGPTPSTTDGSAAARMALLEAQGDDLSVREALVLAVQQATAGTGALGGFVHLRDAGDGGLRLIAAAGLPGTVTDAWAHLPPDRDTVSVRALRDGAVTWAAERGARSGSRATVAVPLPSPGGADPVGVLTLLLWQDQRPGPDRRAFLTDVARWAARRWEHRPDETAYGRTGAEPGRGRDAVAAHADPVAAQRTVRMAELTSALAEAVTAQDVVDAVARRVLGPFGADGIVIEAVENGRLHVVGSVGYAQEFLDHYLEGVPLEANILVADVLRRRRPVLVESTPDFVRRYPELRRLVHSDKNAWAFLPLVASGRDIGCCVISFARPHTFSDEERTLLTALSGLVGQALERARLYDAEHSRAQSLQRGLLPRSLPSLPAATAAARYLPASEGAAVGGDWYDLIPLSADRVAMVVGDVMGHGIAEAATMGRLRTAVRTLADLELPPDEVLGHLNELVKDLGDDSYATCLYTVFDPVSRICTFCRAGHPPPVLVHPDGTLHRPEPTANPPLGVAEPPFDTEELRLPEECLLVYYTDGLIRTLSKDVDEGVDRLVRTVAATVAETGYFAPEHRDADARRLDDLCGTITATLTRDRPRAVDDAALFLTHTRHTDPADVASWPLPEDPRAAAQARGHVRRQLALWGLDDLEPSAEMVVSELVGNAVRHAKGPLRLRLLRSRSLICEVYDGSLTTPRIRRATQTDESGRGLYLVSAFSHRWGARYGADGKCIWAEQELTPETAHFPVDGGFRPHNPSEG